MGSPFERVYGLVASPDLVFYLAQPGPTLSYWSPITFLLRTMLRPPIARKGQKEPHAFSGRDSSRGPQLPTEPNFNHLFEAYPEFQPKTNPDTLRMCHIIDVTPFSSSKEPTGQVFQVILPAGLESGSTRIFKLDSLAGIVWLEIAKHFLGPTKNTNCKPHQTGPRADLAGFQANITKSDPIKLPFQKVLSLYNLGCRGSKPG